MLKKILMLAFVFAIVSTTLLAQSRYNLAQLKEIQKMEYHTRLSGDAIVGEVVYAGKFAKINYVKAGSELGTPNMMNPIDWITSVTEILTGAESIYDMASNASAQTIWQDPNTLDNIHVVCTQAPPGDGTSFPNRNVKYYFSSDRGATFTFITAPVVPKTGFGAIDGTSDGNALIGLHKATHAFWYVDALAGLGSFTELDPGIPASGLSPVWARQIATNSISLTNKFVGMASINGTDSTYRTTGLSFGSSSFLPWVGFNNPTADQAETYSLSRGSDGRIGIAYNGGGAIQGQVSCVFFIESVDNGSTWTTPLKIFNAHWAPTNDTVYDGPVRGVSLVYQGTVPKVVFESVRTLGTSFFPNDPNAGIYFWSTSLPGADPNRSIKIVDSTAVGYHPVVSGGTTSDVFTTICRPSIGKSSDGNLLFVAFMVPTDYVGGAPDTNSFMSVYLTASGNNGTSWKKPARISPYNLSALRDYTYPSVSKVNDVTAGVYHVNVVCLKDSVPGTYVNHAANGQSIAQQVMLHVSMPLVGIQNISSEVPTGFSLMQNYPNPFNPETVIKFAIPQATNVTLKVYSVTGQLVEVLANNESVTAGTHEVKFDASKLSSGIYFYTITAGNFKDTKKMILMK